MIVSLLQLVASPFGRSVAESGGENPSGERPTRDNQGITRTHEVDTPTKQ